MMHAGIRKQVLLLGLLPVSLIAILLCVYFINSQLTSLDRIQQLRGHTISEQLASASEYAVISGNIELLESLTANLIADVDITAIRITDNSHHALLNRGNFTLSISPQQSINTSAVCANSTYATLFCAPIIKVILPVSDFDEAIDDVIDTSGNEIAGYVYIEISSASLAEQRQEAVIRAILITLTILIFTSLFAVRTAVNIAKPIEQLTEIVSQVEHGDLDISIDTSSGAEITSLQNGIRSMVTSLKQHHNQLEDMISKRTAELIEEREQAEQANLAKSKFLAAASHDLRQPLHALRLFIDILNRRANAQEFGGLIEDINRSTDALEELFNNLLDLSRVEANVLTPEISNFSLQYLFERLRTDYSTIAYKKGLWFRIVDTKAIIRSDFSMLERILRNLLSNAIRYTEAGGILIGCRRRNSQLEIQIWDTGIGIPDTELESIFSEFHQINNPERDRTKGVGLGLAIAGGLAKLLNQKILVNSIVGKGTVFSVCVPFGNVSGITTERNSPVSFGLELSDKNIVFIDDEKPVRDAMHHILDECNCNSIIGENIEQITRQLDDEGIIPDIIITDYRLKGHINGIDVIRIMRKRYGSHIKSMIITGDTTNDWAKQAESINSKILFKPVKAENLYKEIINLLK